MRVSKAKLVLLVIMSLFGLWASSMVLVVYYFLKQALPFCPQSTGPGIVLNCDAVLSSGYSQIFGIPLELFAVVYFVVNIFLVFLIAFGRQTVFERALDVLFVWRFIGILIVPYLVFVELFLLKAICVYCSIMHVAIITDFIIISYLLFYKGGSLYDSLDQEAPSPLQPANV